MSDVVRRPHWKRKGRKEGGKEAMDAIQRALVPPGEFAGMQASPDQKVMTFTAGQPPENGASFLAKFFQKLFGEPFDIPLQKDVWGC